jgi:hypothetical protein
MGSWGQYLDENIWEEYSASKSVDFSKLENQEELFLKDQAILYDSNEKTGVMDKKHYTGTDRRQFSFSYYVPSSVLKLTDYSSLEVSYAHRLTHFWLKFIGSYGRAKFSTLAENASGKTPANGARPEDLNTDLLSIGLGAEYRFRLFLDYLHFQQVFHTVGAAATYNQYVEKLSEVDRNLFPGLESVSDLTYRGMGFRADYGLHYRASSWIHYGLKMSYQMAWTTREALTASEERANRQRQLAWLTFGLDLSFIF